MTSTEFTRFPSWNPSTWLGSPKSSAPWFRWIVHLGVNLNCPAHTTIGVLCARAAVATREEPDVANKPPLARIACAPMITLLTRDIIAKIDESGTRNVDIPTEERERAIAWPLYLFSLSHSIFQLEHVGGLTMELFLRQWLWICDDVRPTSKRLLLYGMHLWWEQFHWR